MTLITLILVLGILIFFHELGHFIFAKKYGVYVYEFALGMGPKIFSFKRKDKNDPTLYSLRLLPIGGFCAMAGEVDEDDDTIKKDQFMCNKTKFQRFMILISGVMFNIILAFILLFLHGYIWGHPEQKPVIGVVTEDKPIANAGITVGDEVLKLNGYKINSWDKLMIVLNFKNKDNIYEFEIKKQDGSIKTYEITPEIIKDEDDNETKMFGFGVGEELNTGFISSVKYAFTKLWSVLASMAIIISSLFTGKLSMSSLAGPVGMYSLVGEVVGLGKMSQIMQTLVYFTAYLSVNLAFINAIPFPAFDGGRILFIGIEAITKKPVNKNIEATLHTIGFILLMILMLYITINDVLRLR